MDRTPILTQNEASEPGFATCRHIPFLYSTHFPHLMQQIYRCWAFWNHHKNNKKTPVFLTLDEGTVLENYLVKQPFYRGLIEIFPAMGIKVVRPSQVGIESYMAEDSFIVGIRRQIMDWLYFNVPNRIGLTWYWSNSWRDVSARSMVPSLSHNAPPLTQFPPHSPQNKQQRADKVERRDTLHNV